MKRVIAFIVVGAAVMFSYGYGHSKGYQRGFKQALPVGACYGARSLAGNIGLPIEINCPVIPPNLLPDQKESEVPTKAADPTGEQAILSQ